MAHLAACDTQCKCSQEVLPRPPASVMNSMNWLGEQGEEEEGLYSGQKGDGRAKGRPV